MSVEESRIKPANGPHLKQKPSVPQATLDKWQGLVDLMADLIQVPAGLIMKVTPPLIEVFVSSNTDGNPYELGEKADLETGLYSETVMREHKPLLVPNAPEDPGWDHNPDIELGMIAYLGFPLEWPDGEVFGTICVLDRKKNSYTSRDKKLIGELKRIIETDLEMLLEIIDKQRLEQELRKSESRYRIIADFAYDWEDWKAPDDSYYYISPSCERISGYRPEEFRDNPDLFREIILAEDLELWDNHKSNKNEVSNSHEVEVRIRHKEGSLRWIDHHCQSVIDTNGDFLGWRGSNRDSTEKIETRINIKKQAVRASSLNDVSHLLVKSLDLQTISEACVETARDLLEADSVTIFLLNEHDNCLNAIAAVGSYAEEMLTMKLSMGEGFSGKVAQQGYSEIANRIDLLGTGKQVPGTPVEPESLMCAPLMGKDHIIGVLTLSKLGTGEFEQADLKYIENLANLSAASVYNAQLYQQTLTADRMKSRFLANVSHEIRTPLNSIVGFVSILENQFHDQLGKTTADAFKYIYQGSNRLLQTVHSILDISQVEAGTIETQTVEIDLKVVIRELMAEQRSDTEEKGLQFSFNTTLRKTKITSDEYCVKQVISNLINNAIKFTEKGSIEIELIRRGKKLVFVIRDSGIGISANFLKRIYEAYSQESEGYSKRYQGIGLGLALAKKYIDLVGAEIDVQSKEGQGTTFEVAFPV